MIFTRVTIPNALKAAGRVVRSLFAKDERVLATDAVQAVREFRCLHCPHFSKPTGQCVKCTCVVTLKTYVATESCPIGRWGRQMKKSTGL